MLVANKENGERLSLGEVWDKKELLKIRSQEKFLCPECGEEVVMKLGSKKIWHFSHLAGGSCQYEYDRESEYHLTGKLKLYQWLKNQGIDAALERFDPQMKQKPDITFEWEGQKYAIEFQCSVIAEDIFTKRTKTYFDHGIIPIWIAAGTFINRKASNIAAINNFLYLFIRRPKRVWNLPAFCPISGQFIILHGAVPITARKTITFLEVISLGAFSVEKLLSPTPRRLRFLNIWQTENQKLKSRYLNSPGARQNPFLKELYYNQLSLLMLPPEIGLPVPSSPYIETPPLIWQTYLYLDVFRHYRKEDMISYAKIREAFNKRMKRGEIKLRILPVAGHGDFRYPLAEYVFLLTKVSFLVRINSGSVKVIRELIPPASINRQMEAEADFFAKYDNKITESFYQ